MLPHGEEMSQNLRKEISSLHKKVSIISKALHISQNTIAKLIQKFETDGSATTLQRRPGRPRKLTSGQECLLMKRVEKNRHANSLQLAKTVESQTGMTVSRDTIRRKLQRKGMHGYHPRRKPLLKHLHKRTYSILWSGETKITVFGSNAFKTVWHHKGEDIKEKRIVPTVKHGGGSVLMWGCMTAAGVGLGGALPPTFYSLAPAPALQFTYSAHKSGGAPPRYCVGARQGYGFLG
uniref:Transposase Tc1-like domain-containing protein n=1 Tax=Oryzias latipes TaxID=8090 RepID=A0A3P9KL92_ORYLA